MKYLALEHERSGSTAARFQPHLRAEAFRLWELVQSGLVREVYFRSDRHTAVLMLESAGEPEARRALDDLPLVREGWIEFEIIPLAPYDGFARLFTPGGEDLPGP